MAITKPKKEANPNQFFKEIPVDILQESQPTMRNIIIIIPPEQDEIATPTVKCKR